ncbi:LOW QUALITY PROTEIN: Hypothetical protein PHPALM_2320 [Phytophthora palmivora]|uniref:PH domain-containing protein n=1 Tax=Phytophthora palmivora TaxID=4796 RepID=A0A2P4YQ35_9STRA|nr:LOW QUALITY PROTEIN: Hypothetical protein PHPALM_2320 [Phytophthora palmivora]
MPSASVIADRVGNSLPPHPIPLFVCSSIVDDASAIAMNFEPLSTQRRDYYIALFHELLNFGNFSKRIKIERLHNEAVEAGIPCAVPIGIICSHCPIGAVRLSDADINGYTSVRVPEQLKDLRASVEDALESSSHLLHEYVTLSKLQLETEKEDANTAPEICMMEAYLDKRARGVGNLQANWRMRYVQLTEKEIVYFKHDEGKLEKSKNPFHDKTGKGNKKGSLALARGMQIEPLDYRGKFSLRPNCVKICDAAGNEELILDAFSPEVQRQWVAAITANVKRLELDPRWLAFPRRCVHRMTVGEFLRYSMLYHGDPKKSHTPLASREQFNIGSKRYLFSALVTCALVRDWKTMEALVQPRSAKSTIISLWKQWTTVDFFSSCIVIGMDLNASSRTVALFCLCRSAAASTATVPPPAPAGNNVVQGMVDASAIGYGAILDIAEQRNAPPNLLMLLESLHEKNDSKRGSAGWSCRRDVNASDAASMKITIAIPESVRVDTNWE